MDVQIIIPTIPGREHLLRRALASIRESSVNYDVTVVNDEARFGPARVRTTAVRGDTEFVAFLDDDDELYPGHLDRLVAMARETGADVVYPWFDLNVQGMIRNDMNPLSSIPEGPAFDADRLRNDSNFIPVTCLVRTDMFVKVGGFPTPGSTAWPHDECEDWGLWLRLLDAGARFEHLPERTWIYHWHGRNTSGRPERAISIYR